MCFRWAIIYKAATAISYFRNFGKSSQSQIWPGQFTFSLFARLQAAKKIKDVAKNHYMWIFQNVWKKAAFICSKLTIVTLEQGAKYVQS